GGTLQTISAHLQKMGQPLFLPPSVFGWDWETGWLSSATLLARYTFARDLVAARGSGRSSFPSRSAVSLKLTEPDAIVDAVTDKLGITDQLLPIERQALIDYVTDNGTTPSLDLKDDTVRNNKLHGLFALALQSPAYQLH